MSTTAKALTATRPPTRHGSGTVVDESDRATATSAWSASRGDVNSSGAPWVMRACPACAESYVGPAGDIARDILREVEDGAA